MRALRGLLRLVVVGLLLVRSAAIAPVAVWAYANGSAAECTCTHTGDANCPMHRKTTQDPGKCAMRGLPDTAADVLASMFGLAGLMPTAAASAVPPASGRPLLVARAGSTDRPTPPEPPPPRL